MVIILEVENANYPPKEITVDERITAKDLIQRVKDVYYRADITVKHKKSNGDWHDVAEDIANDGDCFEVKHGYEFKVGIEAQKVCAMVVSPTG